MIYKSFVIEKNLLNLDKKIALFYGENLGLKSDLKKKIISNNKNKKIIKYNQEEILKNNNIFINEIKNFSLFMNLKFFIEQMMINSRIYKKVFRRHQNTGDLFFSEY